MKRKFKNKLIILLFALLSLFILGGCSMGESLDEALENRNLTAQITYYANGGKFENNAYAKNLYYEANTKALNIGVVNPTSGSVTVTRNNFKLLGWYHVERVTDEAKGLCELGDEFDFSQPLQKGDNFMLAAKWQALVGVKVILACDEDAMLYVDKDASKVPEADSFENGDVLGEIDYDSKDQVSVSSSTPEKKLFSVKDKTHTFFGYYWDAECTQPITGAIKRGEEQTTIYAKYIEGDWTFVSTSSDVNAMFNDMKAGKRYWLKNDIDCSSIKRATLTNFNAEIQGNGFALKNLNMTKSLEGSDTVASMLGNIGASAKIENLKIENVNIEITLKTSSVSASVYFLFASKAAEATVTNVTVSGTLLIKGPNGAIVENMMEEDVIVYDNCLFGGYATDDAYLAEAGTNEFVVEGDKTTFVTVDI